MDGIIITLIVDVNQVILRTDEEGVFNGFKARYMFDENNSINRGESRVEVLCLRPKQTGRRPCSLPFWPFLSSINYQGSIGSRFSFSLSADCGSNPSVSGAASGVFTSPKWPEKYERSSGLLSCSWHIQSARDHRILLHFQAFSIEGELESEWQNLLTNKNKISNEKQTFIFN